MGGGDCKHVLKLKTFSVDRSNRTSRNNTNTTRQLLELTKFLFQMDTIRLDEYNKIKTALSSDLSWWDVSRLLRNRFNSDIHAYFCDDLAKSEAVCSRCETLLEEPLRKMDTDMLHVLLQHGTYPPEGICAAGYQYSHTRSTPLSCAVQSGSLGDVRKLLSEGAHDVNWHPRLCASRFTKFLSNCDGCDTPLMAAVRREDIAMMRLLIAHGANVSEVIDGYFGYRPFGPPCLRKTALLVALQTKNKEVIIELVTSGADVNQSLGPIGTLVHYFYDQEPMVQLLIQLGADPNATNENGNTAVSLTLLQYRCGSRGRNLLVQKLLRTLLPLMRNLDALLQANAVIQQRGVIATMDNDCTTLFLQHGATMSYCTMYLIQLHPWRLLLRKSGEQHSERFIELLRAADTDFSGVRQRIASVGQQDCERLNLAVLEQKLSQPLTLQASCVIRVRRQLRIVRDWGMWASIENLPLPAVMKALLKLEIY